MAVHRHCVWELPMFDFRFACPGKMETNHWQFATVAWELQVFDFSFGVHARGLEMSKSTTGSSQLLRWELPMFDFTLGGAAKENLEINHCQFAAVALWNCQRLISDSGLNACPGKMEINHWQFATVAKCLISACQNQPLAVPSCCVGNCRCLISALGFMQGTWKCRNQPLAVPSCCVGNCQCLISLWGAPQKKNLEINHCQFAAVALWNCQRLISDSGLHACPGKMEINHWQFATVAWELQVFDFSFGFMHGTWKCRNQPLAVRSCCVESCQCLMFGG